MIWDKNFLDINQVDYVHLSFFIQGIKENNFASNAEKADCVVLCLYISRKDEALAVAFHLCANSVAIFFDALPKSFPFQHVEAKVRPPVRSARLQPGEQVTLKRGVLAGYWETLFNSKRCLPVDNLSSLTGIDRLDIFHHGWHWTALRDSVVNVPCFINGFWWFIEQQYVIKHDIITFVHWSFLSCAIVVTTVCSVWLRPAAVFADNVYR